MVARRRSLVGPGGRLLVPGGGALAFPIAVLVHELGHFGAYAACGLPDPVLEYASAGWTGSDQFRSLFRAGDVEAATAIAEPWQVAVGAAAGPVVSYLVLIACVLAVRRFGPGPIALVFGIGLVTPFRWIWPVPVLFLRLRGMEVNWGPDEVVVGVLTGVPQFLFILLGLASLVLGYWFIVTAISRGERVCVFVPTLAGAVLGGVVWVRWLGPLVLP